MARQLQLPIADDEEQRIAVPADVPVALAEMLRAYFQQLLSQEDHCVHDGEDHCES